MVVHSNDMYFYGSDGYSKNRESVVLATNCKNEVALAKLTTSENPSYKNVPSYPGSRYMTNDLYTMDNEGNPIVVYDTKYIDNNHKFVKSHFRNVPMDSVNQIKDTLCENERFGKENIKRFNKIKKLQ